MKHIRFIALALVLLVLASAVVTSCRPTNTVDDPLAFTTVYPDFTASTLAFTLSDETVAAFDAQLDACREIYSDGRRRDEQVFLASLYTLNSHLVAIEAQRDVAYLLCRLDLTDEKLMEDYNYADRTYVEVHGRFWSFLRECDSIWNPLSDTVADFYESEFAATASSRSGDADEIYLELSEIRAEFSARAAKDTPEQLHELFCRFLEVSREYARACGYENYYEFASAESYYRDYGAAERELFRRYVKEYLVPLCDRYKRHFYATYAVADPVVDKYIDAPYDSLPIDHLELYVDSLPDTMASGMREAFLLDRVVIGDRDGSYGTAFVTLVGDTPFCYFPEDSQSMTSVSHELGHYYAHSTSGGLSSVSYDLLEVHSQTNTLLLARSMGEYDRSTAYYAFRAYTLYNMCYQAVMATVRDHFDDIVLSDPESHTWSLDKLNGVMRELIEEYGVKDLSTNAVEQLMSYPSRSAVSQSGYNISYGTSFVAALCIYHMSESDYDGALECYRGLVENIDPERSFLGTLEAAGLPSPFEESTYKYISDAK